MFFSLLGIFFIYYLWDENEKTVNTNSNQTLIEHLKEGWAELKSQEILYIGLIESLIVSAFGLFLFAWTPILQSISPEGKINVGFVFITFVMSLILGATLFEIIVIKLRTKPYKSLFFGCLAQILAFLVVVYSRSYVTSLIFLAIINGMIGFMNPLFSSIKSKIIKDKNRSQLMSLFRVPQSIIVSTLLILTNFYTPQQVIFS